MGKRKKMSKFNKVKDRYDTIKVKEELDRLDRLKKKFKKNVRGRSVPALKDLNKLPKAKIVERYRKSYASWINYVDRLEGSYLADINKQRKLLIRNFQLRKVKDKQTSTYFTERELNYLFR